LRKQKLKAKMASWSRVSESIRSY